MTGTELQTSNQQVTAAALPVSLPAWAIEISDGGGLNFYFDAEEAAKRLKPDERVKLSGVVSRARDGIAGCYQGQLHRLKPALIAIGSRVAPGMSEQAAAGWVAGLLASLAKKPFDLLVKAVDCAVTQQFRFPNEVGPWIDEHMAEALANRRRVVSRLMEIEMKARSLPAPKGGSKNIDPAEVDEMNRVMASVNATTRYRPDGTEYQVERDSGQEMRRPTGPARMPTVDDYVELGLSRHEADQAVAALRPKRDQEAA